MELGYPPCYRELAERMNIPSGSKNAVAERVYRLCQKGVAIRDNMVQRSLRLTRAGFEAIGSPPGNPYLKE